MSNNLTFEQEVLFWKSEMERIDREVKEGYEYTEEEINLPYEELNRLTVEKLEREKKDSMELTLEELKDIIAHQNTVHIGMSDLVKVIQSETKEELEDFLKTKINK